MESRSNAIHRRFGNLCCCRVLDSPVNRKRIIVFQLIKLLIASRSTEPSFKVISNLFSQIHSWFIKLSHGLCILQAKVLSTCPSLPDPPRFSPAREVLPLVTRMKEYRRSNISRRSTGEDVVHAKHCPATLQHCMNARSPARPDIFRADLNASGRWSMTHRTSAMGLSPSNQRSHLNLFTKAAIFSKAVQSVGLKRSVARESIWFAV